ncbi:hypothetical protein [Sphingobium nicotianae]|uniref:Uncharacterized protein n=1 Tax=Sphingobium nicotianae TaxID=2782607 RepID=A0A9X1DEF8_9SPHN|nr:hypothetical protein [Sphingobium nicotianae]MBT2188379.1 hypothetical protein [Sphingobium nicotianae]
MAKVLATPAFGPRFGPTSVDVLIGTGYVFLPSCAGTLSMARLRPGQILFEAQKVTVTLSCQ